MLCDDLNERDGGGWDGGPRGRVSVYTMTESLCCTVETNTIL